MASALSNAYLNIADAAKKLDPNGNIAPMVELLSKKNSFLEDISFRQGNMPTGHKFNGRMALPSPAWRKLNAGIPASKSQADTFEETCGMLEGLSKVDVALAELNGDAAAFRADEDNSFFSAFGIEVARALFYESTNTNPERLHGLDPRFGVTSGNVAAAQIIKADATASGSDQTSIWLVGWSPETVFGIFPKNSVAGFHSEDLGKQLVKDQGGTNEYVAYVTHHKWDVGLCVRDYRYVSRVCNIDTSAWKADLSAGADLPLSMQDAIAALYDTDSCDPVFYMNRAAFSMFNKQLMKKGTVNFLEYIERGGRRVPHFLGFPIRISDAITSTEPVLV
jgi:hypothetical protein